MSELVTSTPTETSKDYLTYEDYLTFPDNDGIKKEIIEGELFMSPAPSIKHQRILRELSMLFHNFVKQNKVGEIFFAPCDVVFSDINIMQPDIIFISKNNYEILTDLNIQGAPDLIVEILSPSSSETDRIYKKHIYERFGVKEYWIVDQDKGASESGVRGGGKYRQLCKAGKKDTVKSQLLEGLQIDLSSIFES
ncbi:MAG: Uma2 family endonuclease [candidate division KSB1 bacterium]|nr:Uma2 family endonuclease [candidate division KSB1 bacterium]